MNTHIHIAGRGAVTGLGAGRRVLFERIAAGESALRPRIMVTPAPAARTGGGASQTSGPAMMTSRAAPASREIPAGPASTPRMSSSGAPVIALDTSPEALTAALAFTAEVPLASIGAAARSADLPWLLACAAAREALLEARVTDFANIGLVLASAKADLSGIAGETRDAALGSAAAAGLGSPARLARRIAAELGLGGVTASVSCACASGLVALSLAARRIARGEAERLLVVGVDVVHDFVLAGFASLAALDRQGCRPFDAQRRGLSLGDGAGAILLSAHAEESVGLAITGFGGANDACHATGPDREGAGLALAARRALHRAGLHADDIDLVHLHGTGTIANDACEARGLAAVFGGCTPPAFGTKAQTGHTLGAAGVLETLIAGEALLAGAAPRNVGLQQTDVDPRLDLVREPRRLPRAVHALKLSSGFGGIQAALVLQASRGTGTPLLRSAARDRRISAPPTGIVGIGGTTGIAELVVLAVGVVDGRGVRGSSGVRGEWHAPGVPPLGTGRTFRALFGRGDPTLRRLDRASRALVFAAEAAGIADLVPRDARDGTALVLQTALGCLDADLRFAACAPGAGGAATLFPGTLPSAALGELALRYGWRGPATCLSIGGGSVDGDGDADRDDDGDGDGDDRDGDGTSDGAAALHEAARLLDDGEASHVVAGAFEVLEVAGVTGVAPAVSAVIALLATTRSHAAPAADRVPAAAPLADGGAPAWAPIPWCVLREARDPFALLAASLAAPVAGGAPAQPLAPAPWPARAQGPDAPSP